MNSLPELPFASQEAIEAYQVEQLRQLLRYLQANSPYYRRLLENQPVRAEDIHSLAQLSLLPTTSKRELQECNHDFLAVPPCAVRDYVTTSGTLGAPVIFALTENDLERLAYNELSSLTLAGCSAADTIQLMTTSDRCFMAGLAYQLGARRLGASLIRAGSGMPEFQWRSILSMQPNVCIAVPSFLLKLAEYAQRHGIDYRRSSLTKAMCIGESLYRADGSPTTLAARLQAQWPELSLFSTYASTEMQTAITECPSHMGAHIPPDLLIAEVLDDAGTPLPPGQVGELAITTLGVEGMPLLRFQTGDICRQEAGLCACGRHTARLSAILGRKKHMIKLKGTTFYPPALFDILDAMPDVTAYIVEVRTNAIGTDEVQVKLSVDQPTEDTELRIKNAFRAKVRVAPTLIFESQAAIEEQQQKGIARKLTKFLDLR